jgi:putative (di)nucleoside polyphosphate hydrolase
MLDKDGYRPNVGIILCNAQNQVFWARRRGHDGWQFPQGGIKSHENSEQALFRELHEEIGLEAAHVTIIGRTGDWLYYNIPERFRRRPDKFKGQKQLWYLLRLGSGEQHVCLDRSPRPEFDAWRWVEYWQPLDEIVDFKRQVYLQALTELEPLLSANAG